MPFRQPWVISVLAWPVVWWRLPISPPLEMGLMSLLVYAGGFSVCYDIFDCRSFVPYEYCLNRLFINLRNMLMSLHTSPDFKEASLVHNIGIGSLLTDESYRGLFE